MEFGFTSQLTYFLSHTTLQQNKTFCFCLNQPTNHQVVESTIQVSMSHQRHTETQSSQCLPQGHFNIYPEGFKPGTGLFPSDSILCEHILGKHWQASYRDIVKG